MIKLHYKLQHLAPEDPENYINQKFMKRPITFHYSINWILM